MSDFLLVENPLLLTVRELKHFSKVTGCPVIIKSGVPRLMGNDDII